jgi:alpha-D-xyloside xylohydrolase
MITRALESKRLMRASVRSLALAGQGDSFATFSTEAVLSAPGAISSADSAMLQQASLAPAGTTIGGTLRIDAVADNVFRVRYAEGGTVPENQTPMLAEGAAKRGPLAVAPADGSVVLSTGRIALAVDLSNGRMVARCAKTGRELCGVGGPETNLFMNWDACNTGICRAFEGQAPLAVECFDLDPDEAVYGMGEKFIRLNKVGQTIDQDLSDALGVLTPRSYKCIPFHVSTRGYGVFFNHSSKMTYWVGSRCASRVQVALNDDFLDYFLLFGPIAELLPAYQELTGRGAMPPEWTFGYWQSKISYTAADETLDIAGKLRASGVPCDVIHLDTHWFKADWYCDLLFDRERFPDPKAWFDRLRELGFHVSLWQLPYIPEGSQLFDDLRAVDGFVKNEDGSIHDCRICFTPGFHGIVGVIDYTNPEAVRVHQTHLRRLFDLGAGVIKADFGESAPGEGAVYHDGTPARQMHNRYPLLYNRALYEVTREATGEGVIWARSAWAGSQRYPLHWGGDNSPHFDNMIPQIAGGLSFGLSGFNFWSQDIGGFLGDTGGDLLIRWMQLGMFCSHSRIHGSGDRELYKFDERTFTHCRDIIRLRYRLLPYILGSARSCVARGLPLMRALPIDFQDDPATWNLESEFLFGDSLLVAPVYSADGRRRIYFPRDNGEAWTCWWTGQTFAGGQWIDADVPIDRIPLFVRAGGIVPMGPLQQYVGEKPLDALEVVYAPRNDGRETRLAVRRDDGTDCLLSLSAGGLQAGHADGIAITPKPLHP